MKPSVFTWITENWQTILAIFGGIGAAWTFIGKRYREIISAPFRKKQEKLTLDNEELSFVEKLQQFQEDKLNKILDENKELWQTIDRQRDAIFKAEEKIKESAEEIQKAVRKIKYYERLLIKNKIEFNKDYE